MNIAKSLILGSAATLVALGGAQAADLPLKAKAVEYVKVCSLYGAGFYYIPGTDICMKVGGYVRYQVSAGMGSSPTSGPFASAAGWNNMINTNNVTQRVRAIATFDTRQQTAYGTLRTYLSMGFNQDTNAGPTTNPGNYINRAFIQIAGFTLGKATSFFDFVSTAAVAYNAGMLSAPDTGDGGMIGGWYTAQIGNGWSASIGIEQAKNTGTLYLGGTVAAPNLGAGQTAFSAPTFATGTLAAFDNNAVGGTGAGGSASNPAIVGNIRVDQAWGSFQVSGVLKDSSAGYYGNGTQGGAVVEGNGRPGSKWGWGISSGLRLNAPMIGPGDYFQVGAVYTEGAFGYASNTPYRGAAGQGSWALFKTGNQIGLGVSSDAVFGNTATSGLNSIELTTAWSVMASYEHFWTPALRTSIYGSYLDVSYNSNANLLMCNAMITGGVLAAGSTCNTNWSSWQIGSRSQWNVTKDFYVGVDVMYDALTSMKVTNAATTTPVIAPGGASGVTAGSGLGIKNADAVVVTWRAHRDIVP